MGDGAQGWSLSSVQWSDGEALVAQGSAGFGPDAILLDLDIELRSRDLSGLAARYLSGWLAIVGLPDLSASGALDARVRMADGRLSSAGARLHVITLDAAGKGLALDGLDVAVRPTGGAPVDRERRWR